MIDLPKTTRIYVAGHRGMVGAALVRQLNAAGFDQIITRTSAELDLRIQADVAAFFATEQPQVVLLAAARVGGILANNNQPAEFIHDNLVIQSNVIEQAYRNGVKRLLFLGSSCIYPRECAQPMAESALLTGPLEPTNAPYAVAKIAGITLCESYNRQYGTDYLAAMPTNLYGPGDNYDLQGSHVLPAMIRKFSEAKTSGAPSVTLWGTGSPRREFLHVDDLAEACLFLLGRSHSEQGTLPLVNVGWGKDISIRELAELVQRTVGYTGEIIWDTDKPDGTPQKLLNIDRIVGMGWSPRIDLAEGVARTVAHYQQEVAEGYARA